MKMTLPMTCDVEVKCDDNCDDYTNFTFATIMMITKNNCNDNVMTTVIIS